MLFRAKSKDLFHPECTYVCLALWLRPHYRGGVGKVYLFSYVMLMQKLLFLELVKKFVCCGVWCPVFVVVETNFSFNRCLEGLGKVFT